VAAKRAGLGDLGSLKKALAEQRALREKQQRDAALAAAKAQREANLFRLAVGPCEPLPERNLRPVTPSPVEPIPKQRLADEKAALASSLSDDIDIESLLDTDASLSYRRPGIGPEVPHKLRRGFWSVKAQIDLHGLRVEQARDALVEFLNEALRQEMRCVRVIHGKGLGSAHKQPVLKGKVLKWLVQREEVLAFTQARPNDGGAGALIVLLKGVSRKPLRGQADGKPA
jgi:DNA-nicking Smr family endonuclease